MQSTRITSLGISISLLILGLVACNGAAVPEASSTPTTAQPTVSEPTDTPRSTPVPTATSVPTPTIAPTPTPEPINLMGRGQQASSKFDLNQGLAIFEMTHDGQSNFAIQLLDNQGNFVDLLVNEIGTFNGSKVLGIEESGPHILDISADANWTVDITQSAPISEMTPPINLSGKSQQASQFFKLGSGLTTFRMTHDGNSNFAVLLLDERGDFVELLANDIGDFDGSKAVGIDEAGVYILDISADGNWTVSIEQ